MKKIEPLIQCDQLASALKDTVSSPISTTSTTIICLCPSICKPCRPFTWNFCISDSLKISCSSATPSCMFSQTISNSLLLRLTVFTVCFQAWLPFGIPSATLLIKQVITHCLAVFWGVFLSLWLKFDFGWS